MASRRHERTAARQSALQVLYTSEIKGTRPSDLLDSGLVLEDDGKSLSDYAIGLIEGVDEKMLPIDVRLNSTSENWKLNRMPIVDRNILRLALYEMIEEDDITVAVAIDEAVELAKAFGTDESPRFINGVLGTIAKDVEAGIDVYEKARQMLHAAQASPLEETVAPEDEAGTSLEAPLDDAPIAGEDAGDVAE